MAVPLTADICAHAVIAAAQSYGVDPIRCVLAKRGINRGPIVAAASAVYAMSGLQRSRVSEMFALSSASMARAERVGGKAFERATAAARRAMVAAGISLTEADLGFGKSPPARIAPAVVVPQDAPDRRTRPVPARGAGTVVSPPPVAPEAPAEPARVDHTAAIAEAMARRRERGDVSIEVVGVENDKALIGATEPGGCVWPMGDPREPGYRSCQTPTLAGRMYCAEHLKKAGMKVAPKTVAVVGRVARPYGVRELEAEG